jgi:hypothetical protein
MGEAMEEVMEVVTEVVDTEAMEAVMAVEDTDMEDTLNNPMDIPPMVTILTASLT